MCILLRPFTARRHVWCKLKGESVTGQNVTLQHKLRHYYVTPRQFSSCSMWCSIMQISSSVTVTVIFSELYHNFVLQNDLNLKMSQSGKQCLSTVMIQRLLITRHANCTIFALYYVRYLLLGWLCRIFCNYVANGTFYGKINLTWSVLQFSLQRSPETFLLPGGLQKLINERQIFLYEFIQTWNLSTGFSRSAQSKISRISVQWEPSYYVWTVRHNAARGVRCIVELRCRT